MENLECGVYITTNSSKYTEYTFVVLVATNGSQSWLRLKPDTSVEILYTYANAATAPKGYTYTRISEALQEVFLK